MRLLRVLLPQSRQGVGRLPPEDADGFDESGVRVYCPACANAWFGHRPEAAAKHVCIWKPPPDSRPNSTVPKEQDDHSV